MTMSVRLEHDRTFSAVPCASGLTFSLSLSLSLSLPGKKRRGMATGTPGAEVIRDHHRLTAFGRVHSAHEMCLLDSFEMCLLDSFEMCLLASWRNPDHGGEHDASSVSS